MHISAYYAIKEIQNCATTKAVHPNDRLGSTPMWRRQTKLLFQFFFLYIHIYYLVTAKSCKYVFMLHTLRFMCVGGQCPRCRSRRSRLLRSSAAALVSQGWGKLCLHDFVGAQYFGRFIAIVIERKGKIFTTWKVRNFAQHFSALKNIFFCFFSFSHCTFMLWSDLLT